MLKTSRDFCSCLNAHVSSMTEDFEMDEVINSKGPERNPKSAPSRHELFSNIPDVP
jgi:hypothetical protein